MRVRRAGRVPAAAAAPAAPPVTTVRAPILRLFTGCLLALALRPLTLLLLLRVTGLLAVAGLLLRLIAALLLTGLALLLLLLPGLVLLLLTTPVAAALRALTALAFTALTLGFLTSPLALLRAGLLLGPRLSRRQGLRLLRPGLTALRTLAGATPTLGLAFRLLPFFAAGPFSHAGSLSNPGAHARFTVSAADANGGHRSIFKLINSGHGLFDQDGRHIARRKGRVLLSRFIGFLFIAQAAHEAPAETGDFRRVKR